MKNYLHLFIFFLSFTLLGQNKNPHLCIVENNKLENFIPPSCDCTEQEIENTTLDTVLVQLFFKRKYIEHQIVDTATIKSLVVENGEILNFQLKDNYPDLSGELVYEPEIIVLDDDFVPESIQSSFELLRHFRSELSYHYPKKFNFKILFIGERITSVAYCNSEFSVVGISDSEYNSGDLRELAKTIQHEMGHNLSAGHHTGSWTCSPTLFTNANRAAHWENALSSVSYGTAVGSGNFVFRFYSTGGLLKIPTVYLKNYMSQSFIDASFLPQSIGNSPDTLVFNCCTANENNLLGIKYRIQQSLCHKKKTIQTAEQVSICEGESYLGYNSNGKYGKIYSSYNGCDSIHTIHLTVNGLPTINSVTGNNHVILNTDETYQVYNNSGSNYNWAITNGEILAGQGTNMVDINWTEGIKGQLCVSETNLYGCQSEQFCIEVSISNLKIFPNPSPDNVTISWDGGQTNTMKYSVYSIDGKLIKEGIINNRENLQIGDLSQGIYPIKIFNNELTIHRKIIKI